MIVILSTMMHETKAKTQKKPNERMNVLTFHPFYSHSRFSIITDIIYFVFLFGTSLLM